MRRVRLLLVCFGMMGVACSQSPPPHSVSPRDGFVPNAETAIRIAEAVWLPIYGSKELNQERPFVAELRKDIWTVSGSLPKPPEGYEAIGGTAEIEISRKDGRVLRVSHGE